MISGMAGLEAADLESNLLRNTRKSSLLNQGLQILGVDGWYVIDLLPHDFEDQAQEVVGIEGVLERA